MLGAEGLKDDGKEHSSGDLGLGEEERRGAERRGVGCLESKSCNGQWVRRQERCVVGEIQELDAASGREGRGGGVGAA